MAASEGEQDALLTRGQPKVADQLALDPPVRPRINLVKECDQTANLVRPARLFESRFTTDL